MAAGDTFLGTGTTLTFTGVNAEVLNLSWSINRASVQTSHLGTTVSHTFLPGSLYDGGEVTAECHLKDTDTLLPTGAAGTLTITFAGGSGATSDADWEAQAFLTGIEMNNPLEDVITTTMTFKVTGNVVFTAAV
jgi:hypothetical protein